MEVVRLGINDRMQIKGLVATLGQFDGIHIGHMKLIEEVKRIAGEEGLKTGLITFDPHPDFVLKKRENLGYLLPLSEKIKELEQFGFDYMILIDFSIPMSEMLPEEFFDRYLKDIETLVVGSDFRFGYRGRGNVELLDKISKRTIAIEVVKHNEIKIGSNQVREFLINGEVDKINTLLNHYYSISGKVIHGSKVGRTMGIRTANVELTEEYQLIKKGVYATIVHTNDGKYLGVCNIGNNPTINYVEKMRLEVHLLDFDRELYYEDINIDFLERIRDEIFFKDVKELIRQIKNDIEYVSNKYRGKL